MYKEKDELKKPYEAPRLTAVSFLPESGFAVSGLGFTLEDPGEVFIEERRESSSNWGGGDGWF